MVVTLQTVAPTYDGYRTALWLVATDEDGPPPRQLTLGTRHDRHPRFSPDGSTLAFLSDRRTDRRGGAEPRRVAKDREDATQVHLLPLDGGEARRLTDLPRGVTGFEWSPDGTRLVVTSPSHAATWEADRRRRGLTADEPGTPPPSDYRYIDRLHSMLNGADFIYDRIDHLWLVDAATGVASRLTDGPVADTQPAWSPDGRRIAFTSDRGRDADLVLRSHIHVVDVATRTVTRDQRGPGVDVRVPDVDAGRALAARDGRPSPGERCVRQRPVGLRGGRVGRDARRRPQRLAPPRPDAALGDDQRRHGGRAGASGGRRRRDPRRHDRPDRRVVRALADRPGRRPARAADRGPAPHLGLGRACGVPRAGPGGLPPLVPDRAARRLVPRRRRRSRAASPRSTPTCSTSSSSARRSSGT